MLAPFAWIYGKIADVRNSLFERGVLQTHTLGAKTISIGNITAGGTGKTPLVALVSEILAEKGETVCILTRGYGRKDPKKRVLVSDWQSVIVDAASGGDEPVELAQRLLGRAVVVADPDRVGAAQWAKDEFGITAFVLDDGFQHRRAKRDLDIVCIDASDPFGGRKMLPSGRLREPLHNLKRADIIVITRADMTEGISNLKSEIAEFSPDAALFTARNRVSRLIPLADFPFRTLGVEWNEVRTHSSGGEVRILAFCGLGNPQIFFLQISDLFEDETMNDFDLAVIKDFPDHHFYTQTDILNLEKQAEDAGIHAMLTTAKDAVKLKDLTFTIPCFVVEVETVLDDQEAFSRML